MEGISTQVFGIPVCGDQLWEDKSTLYWILVIIKAGHQREFVHSGKQTPDACGGQIHSICPIETQYRGSSLKDLQAVGRVPEG